MFECTKDFEGRPEFEKELVFEFKLYRSLFQLISVCLEALQITCIPEREQRERKIALISLVQSIQEQVDYLFKALSEKPNLNTPTSSPESPCRS